MNPWLKSLLASMISGTATALSVIVVAGFDWNNWKVALAAAATGAVSGLVLYLKDKPWPTPRDVWTPEQRAERLGSGLPNG